MRTTLVDQLHKALLACDQPPEDVADSLLRKMSPLIDEHTRRDVVHETLASLTGLGPLQQYVDDPTVREVMVVSGRHVWVEDASGIRATEPLAAGQFDVIVERLLRKSGRRIDYMSPTVETRLPSGARVCAVIPPVAVDGGILCIRRFTDDVLPLAAFCPPTVVNVLDSLVQSRRNIVVSGPTSSGKTSLLASMATLLAPHERIVTIEDTAELRIPLPHVVRLESRQANSENMGAVALDHLVRTAMRLRPDRIIVGEVRGNEVVDMLSALGTGHDGSWTTVHSNNPRHTLARLESLTMRSLPNCDASSARRMVRDAIDAVVHLDKSTNGERRIVDIVALSDQGDVTLVADGSVCTPETTS